MKPNRLRNGALKGTFDWAKFGKHLAAETSRRGGSIRDIATGLGISHTALYERMSGRSCTVELMMFLCTEFGLSPWEFFSSKKVKRSWHGLKPR